MKRYQNREVLMLLNKTPVKRGRPPKIIEEVPVIEPLEEDEPFKMEDLDDDDEELVTSELELPPKPEYKPLQRSKKLNSITH